MSHPTWVRGLKHRTEQYLHKTRESHPTWVRGLKLYNSGICKSNQKSHPTWVRGLKQLNDHKRLPANPVAPYVGAWIETDCLLVGCE